MVPFYTRQDLLLYEGDNLEIALAVQDVAGNPIDLTGATVSCRIGDRSNPAILSPAITVTNAAGGLLKIAMTGTDVLVPNQQYEYQVRLVDSPVIKTILAGLITVRNGLFV